MKQRKLLGALGGIKQKARQRRRAHDGGDTVFRFQRRRNLHSEAIPLFQLGIERLEKENDLARVDGIERIEQQRRARLIGDTSEVAKVRVGAELTVNARIHITRKRERDRVLELGEDGSAASGVFGRGK